MLFGRKNNETGADDAQPDSGRDRGAAVAVAESMPALVKKGKKKDDGDLEYEWELETPFGKIEFEIQPAERKEEKERERRAKAERDAAKQAAKLAKRAERAAQRQAAAGEVVVVKRSNLVPALVIFAIVVGAIAVAFWLFARPGDDDADVVPEEFRADGVAAAVEPQGVAGRLKEVIRAGRQASREAQREQQQKFEDATKQR